MSISLDQRPGNIPNYRQQLKKALPPEYLKPDYTNLWWFPAHAAIIGTCYWLLSAHFTWWFAPLASLIVGHSIACLGFVAHDILHGGSIKNAHLKDALAGIGFSPLWIGPYLWRRWHNAEHHNNTNVEGIDPDHLFTMEDYEKNPILRALYKVHPLIRNVIIFSSFAYRMTQQNLRMVITYLRSPKSTSKDRFTLLWQLFLPMAAWTALSLSLGSQVFWWGYVGALFVGNTIAISYIATNHFLNPLADERDVLATSLTVTLPRWLRFLDPWHQCFGAHVSHHLFPQASVRYTRRIEEKVEEMWPDRYHSMSIFKALKALWDTPWLYADKDTLIDPKSNWRVKTLGRGLSFPIKRRRRKS
jgi:fatty acid desaturase